MKEIIKGYKWLPWAIAVAIVIAIEIIASPSWFLFAPWQPAKTVMTQIAIDAFSSGTEFSAFVQENATYYWDFRLAALAAILLTFIVGPSLWVYAEVKNQNSESRDVLKKEVVWYVGVIFLVAGLQVVPATFIKGIVFQDTWESAAQSKHKDELRSGLMKLGYDALQIYQLPKEMGGGAGSFQIDRGNGKVSPVQLVDLKNYPQSSPYSYQIATVDSDSLIKIHAVSDIPGADPDFKNADGTKGKLQMTLEVKPPASFEFEAANEN